MKGCALLYGFPLQPKQGQTVTPRGLAGPTPGQGDGRIAIVVALDAPLDAECAGRRRLDSHGARLRHRARRLCRQHVRNGQREKTEQGS